MNKFVELADGYKDLDVIKLRDNASLISTANQYDIDSISFIYDLLNNTIANVSASGMREEFMDYSIASTFYKNSKTSFDFAKNVLIQSDMGINNISIEEFKDDETDEVSYFPLFEYAMEDENRFLIYRDQSSGVKALYKQLGAYQFVLEQGGLLILDEFDINLHPDLLPVLIDLFEDSKKNSNNAQFIFTTHNTEIMDKLKKYRVVLVNKEDNESYLYRLDEPSEEIIRNDRSLAALYDSGKIGGKPKLKL